MMHQNHKKTVAIIGSGPAGLLATKYAKDYGFEPYTFQKNQQIGGVWNPQQGAVWKQMTTNLSKHTCSFFDFPWLQQAPIYPSSGQMFDYLTSYANSHDLLKHIKFGSEVIEIKKIEDNKATSYTITYRENEVLRSQKFEYVIVASGIFNAPYIPELSGLKQFKGKIMHSKDFRDGQEFKDKNVLIIGGSFTGVQLASNVSKHASKVIHSFTKPFWVLPHFIGTTENKMPIDFFYNREFYLSQPSKTPNFDKNNRYSKSICKQQQQFEQLRISESQFQLPIYVTISSNYIQNFKCKRIFPYRSKISEIQQNSVKLICINEKGETKKQVIQQIDSIIFCTGYKSCLNYLSQDMKQVLEYDQNDRLQPIILYKEMHHPQLENIFFTGMYKGPFFPVIQLQVKAAFEYFTGKAILPSKQQIQKSLQQQRQIRMSKNRSQFPHPDYINFADSIAKFASQHLQLDKLINLAKSQSSQHEQTRQKQNRQKQQALNFFKMSVFPCIPHRFTTININQQLASSTQLIQNFINNSIHQH